MNKKGQITIFVIIGLIILVGASLFFFLNNSINEGNINKNPSDLTTSTNKNFNEVNTYVGQCIVTLSQDALEEIGQHGGYLKSNLNKKYLPAKPYDSEVVSLTNSKEGLVPYWLDIPTSVAEDENIHPTFNIPSLEEIQHQEENYVDKNLLSCLNDFKNLDFSGNKINILNNPKTQVTFTQDSVVIKTNLPLEITTVDGSKSKINLFSKELKIPFKKYYFVAKSLTVGEYSNQYLEHLLTTLISYYGYINSSSLPPFYGVTSGYNFVSWMQSDVNTKLKYLLSDYVSLISVKGTKNELNLSNKILNPQEKAFLKSLTIPALAINYPELEINHYYSQWPIYSKVSPSKGELITPENLPYNIPNFFNGEDQRYNFFYDVSYPVIVEIKEDNLSNGNSFSFMFAMESNIRKNLNWKEYFNHKGPIEWNPQTDVKIINKNQKEVFDPILNESYVLNNPAKKLFGEKDQFISKNLVVKTIDFKTGLPLDDVDVTVGIGNYASVNLGKTKIINGEAKFIGPGPIIKNGYLKLSKEGYLTITKPISLTNDSELIIDSVIMYPEHTKKINVTVIEIKTVTDPESGLVQKSLISRPLKPFEKVSLSLNYLNLDGTKSDYVPFAQFSNETNFTTINLVPGRYSLDAMLFDNNGVVIPKFSKKICNGKKECKHIPEDKQYIPYKDLEMKPAIWGGASFDEKLPWFISTDDVYSNSTISFFVIKFPPPKTIDDLSKIGSLDSISRQYRSKLLPQVKK